MPETIATGKPVPTVAALPVDAVTLDAVEPGQYHEFSDRLTHTKSVPFVIVAQALRGRYEVHCGGRRAVVRPGECFLLKPNTEVTIVHRADTRGTMAARWEDASGSDLG